MKFGIITFYHDCNNYGAILQAYALCYICNKLGFKTEQIDYYNARKFRHLISLSYRKLFKKKYYISKEFYTRKMAIKRFRDSIPHSNLYFKETLSKSNQEYTGFIVGSDQVWNPDWLTDAFALKFVNSSKRKISYAASLGREKLNSEEKRLFSSLLENMDYISVREKTGVSLLSQITTKPVEWVLDPTLLLSRDEWDQIATSRIIKSCYIFCYFLNDCSSHRDIANAYAKSKHIKIATLPYLSYQARECDDGFGDYRLYDVSPCDFISLIKYADYVFTDSFHATVFCHLYNKEFAVFSQSGKESRVRMDSLTDLFCTSERHLVGDDLLKLETIFNFTPINYTEQSEMYLKIKAKSIDFLIKSLSSVESNND